ncbi:PAS domain-containing sensor histidine kinase [Sphaerisporangium perillae]|uniref:PAS domain-containing sensor histidine kinase n=1 Tax=Sphaerisporangium perillae TaxID=2935860 RepID=UPI00200D6D04|nr:PAS domain-containing sensor histidine kinase [Sphaerisporangium perillae]
MVVDTEVDYRAVFKALVAPLLVLTPDFAMVAANDAYLKVVGRSEADLLGRHYFAVFPGNPNAPNDPDVQGAEGLRDSLGRVLATGEPDTMALQRYDIEASGRPGVFEERYWSTINTPVLGPDGEVQLIIHRTEEITDFLMQLRRLDECDVTEARAKLEAMGTDVYVRARELQDLNEQLKQAHRQQRQTVSVLREAIERQRRFVFDASHDLRNPITGILTDIEVAISEPDSDLRQMLRRLLLDAERLNDIVGDLLELARLDTATPPATEPVDLAHLVMDELERRTLTPTLLTKLDQQVVVHASRIRLARLLGNLVANAERHTTTTIAIIVTTDPPDAVLEVIDDGPGIAPADRERVFERLSRLDDARRLDPGGSGLGLPIAREIAQSYGGHLYAADHPTGARFVLRLPLAA